MDRSDPERDDQRPLLPAGFTFGVATAGFQIEGGYNGPDDPANNWEGWERSGRVEPSGIALDFWHRYEEQLDRVASLGCDSFRLSVEWARVEPEEGRIDGAALSRYGAILEACRGRGLEPLVSLHHFTHPDWLGADLWLRPDAPERFAAWVEVAAGALGGSCHHWVTLNEPNVLAVETYLVGAFPPGRVGDLAAVRRAMDNLFTAHVLGYDALHRVQPDAVVATNTFAMSVYELDRLPLDILAAKGAGIGGRDLEPHLAERRRAYHEAVGEPRGPVRRTMERAARRKAASSLPVGAAFARTTAAAAASTSSRLLDVAQLDYYQPVVADHFSLPGRRTAGGRTLSPGGLLWDDRPNPDGLVTYCRENAVPGLDLWIVENGLCNRVRKGRAFQRLDRWRRPRYLRENLGAVVRAVEAGIPVNGYWHWTLADNYEWGSYEPRFGLFGIDRERDVRWLETDSMGDDAAGTYRSIVAGLRAGDRSVLDLRASDVAAAGAR